MFDSDHKDPRKPNTTKQTKNKQTKRMKNYMRKIVHMTEVDTTNISNQVMILFMVSYAVYNQQAVQHKM